MLWIKHFFVLNLLEIKTIWLLPYNYQLAEGYSSGKETQN